MASNADNLVAQYGVPVAPTKESRDTQSSQDQVGGLEALLRGGAQGASLGFSDEATAGLKSILGQGNYQDLVAQERARNEAAASQHPFLYHGGSIAGGVASFPILGELGLVGEAGEGAGALGKILQATKTGATVGAIAGAGQADSGIENTLKGAAAGGAIGGLTGGALQTGFEGIKGGANVLSKFGGGLGTIGESTKAGLEGTSLLNARNSLNDFEQQVKDLGQKHIADKFTVLSNQIDNLLDRADQNIGPEDVSNILDTVDRLKDDLAQKGTKQSQQEFEGLANMIKTSLQGPEQEVSRVIPTGETQVVSKAIPGSQDILEQKMAQLRADNPENLYRINTVKDPVSGQTFQRIEQQIESGGVPEQLKSGNAVAVDHLDIPEDMTKEEYLDQVQKTLEQKATQKSADAAAQGLPYKYGVNDIQDPDLGNIKAVQAFVPGEQSQPNWMKVGTSIPASEASPEVTASAMAEQISKERPGKFIGGRDLQKLEVQVGDVANELQGMASKGTARQEVADAAKELDGLVTDTVNDRIPGYEEVRQKYSALFKALDELGINSDDLIKTKSDGTKSLNPDFISQLGSYFEKELGVNLKGKAASENIAEFGKYLQQAGSGSEVEGDIANVQKAAKNLRLAKFLEGSSVLPNPSRLGTLVKPLAQTGNFLGQKLAAIEQPFVQKSVPVLQATPAFKAGLEGVQGKISDLTPEGLTSTASQLSDNPQTAHLGENLRKVIQSGNRVGQAAAINTIMQNPIARKQLRGE